ncbi:MAG: cation:proton antiporter [Piscirickettsiaceae bacterium]|nr:cation:proton antiporter [Piscirickettsiaceae bacterium]
MDFLWLLIALALGFTAQQIRLPPLVGFLCAGFALHALGIEGGPALEKFADLGITLLLFTIGLKLRLRNLLAPEVWGTACLHMASLIVILVGLLLIPTLMGLSWLGVLDWQAAAVISFALSFSSTVFAVKTLEDRGEMKSRHGQVAIGILIIQDIIAVIFLTLATDKSPTLWALLLLCLPFLRPLLNHFMERSGHGEILVLFGIFMAIGGGELFELVGMKADLGALIIGVMLSGQRKSGELSRTLLSFKDLFLIGFFLSIGINALPTMSDLVIAVGLVLLVLPIKTLLFFGILTRFRIRARTAYLSTTSLANYSEFGLIVAAVGGGAGWIDQQWLMIIAISLSFSFVIGSIVNVRVHSLYASIEHYLHYFETDKRLASYVRPDLGDAEILVVGMGRVGSGAYLAMRETYADMVYGIDADIDKVNSHQRSGHQVILGDAEDIDFWHDVDISKLRLIMLAMPSMRDMQQAVKFLNNVGYSGAIAAVAKHDDDRIALEAAGVHESFNFYAEAGAGFAEHARQQLEIKTPSTR